MLASTPYPQDSYLYVKYHQKSHWKTGYLGVQTGPDDLKTRKDSNVRYQPLVSFVKSSSTHFFHQLEKYPPIHWPLTFPSLARSLNLPHGPS